MSRQYVLAKVPVIKIPECNAFMVALYGDPPGSQEVRLNSYVDGGTPTIATFGLTCSNNSQADADTLTAYFASVPGCASAMLDAGEDWDFWAEAYTRWSILPVIPEIEW